MKILLSGYHNPNFIETVFYRERAVEYLGHELVKFDDRKFLIPGRFRDQFPFLQKWDLQRLNQQLINLVQRKKPDLCLMVGGQRILPQTVQTIKKLGVPIILWTTDVPIDFKNILEAAPFYDHLFCAGSEAADIFQAQGLGNVDWVPFACDPIYHKRVELSESEKKAYTKDITFVGSHYPNRAKLLECIADFDIKVWGPYWRKLPQDSKLKSKTVDVKMNYDQWVKIYNAAKICVVIHYQDPGIPCHQAMASNNFGLA